jgi:hypothetical protein
MITRRAYQRYITEGTVYLFTTEGKEVHLLLSNLSGEGAGVYGNYPLEENQFVNVTIKSNPYFDGFSNRRVRIAWCKQVKPNCWEAGLDFMKKIF